MSKAPDGIALEELNVEARNVLLDGLDALREHLHCLTVVGAQAVYLRTEHVPLATAAYTSDGDLGLDPNILEDVPLIEQSLRGAGFEVRSNQPGLWERQVTVNGIAVAVELDILVGQSLAPGGKRSADIAPHNRMTARRVPGLETAVVDRSPMTITALDDTDRSVTVHVAGTVALLVAKAHKLHDRLKDAARSPDRLVAKDAADVYRLLAGTNPRDLSASFAVLLADRRVGEVTATGLTYLSEQFGGSDAPGVRLAVDALTAGVPESRIRTLMPTYVRSVLATKEQMAR